MSIESVDIAQYSTAHALQQVNQSAEVNLFRKQQDQSKSVAAKLLEGIAATPRASGQTGQNLNIKA